ncbi:hypothetical protein EC968_010054, partial [Mortierella alpina]
MSPKRVAKPKAKDNLPETQPGTLHSGEANNTGLNSESMGFTSATPITSTAPENPVQHGTLDNTEATVTTAENVDLSNESIDTEDVDMDVDKEPLFTPQETLESEEDIFNTGIDVPLDTLEEAKSTVKALLIVQAAQLKAMLAVKRHVQQNPMEEPKFEDRLRKMKSILDARSQKIKDTQHIIRACDAVQMQVQGEYDEDRPVNGSESGNTTRGNNSNSRSYSQPAFINIPAHWPRFRGANGIANTQQFFDAFKQHVIPAINPEALSYEGNRYLELLINREEDSDSFRQAVKDDKATSYDADTLERIFLMACITPEEREQ